MAVVEGHDVCAALEQGEGVPATTAAHVEDAVAGTYGELVEVDGQHG
jgi:hypothetical protein